MIKLSRNYCMEWNCPWKKANCPMEKMAEKGSQEVNWKMIFSESLTDNLKTPFSSNSVNI